MKLLLAVAGISVVVVGCEKQVTTVIDESGGLNTESLFAINSNRSVTIGWSPVVNGTPREIAVYRSAVADFSPSYDTYYATIPGSQDRFVDSALSNGQYYYYRIIPVKVTSGGAREYGTASNVAVGRPFDYGAVTTISYSTHIQSIFTSNCAVHGCHVGPDEAEGHKENFMGKSLHGGQFSLKSWEDLFEGSNDVAVVIPYKAQKSDLIFHTNSDTLLAPVALPHMPLMGFDLPSSQIQALIRWIDRGAPSDQGAIAYTATPRGKIFAVNAMEDLVAAIDVEKNLAIRYINVGSSADSTSPFGSPHHVRGDEQGRYLYVTLITSREFWKFSARTYEFLGKVTIPSQPGRAAQPADIALSATEDTAFVSDFNSSPGRIAMIDTRSMQVIGMITLAGPLPPTLPHGVLISHDRSRLFVTNSGTGNISMVRLSDMTQTLITLDTTGGSITTSTNPYLTDITPDDRYVFVTDFRVGAQNIYVIDLQQDTTKARKAVPIGGRSVHAAVTPNGQSVWICNFSNNAVDIVNVSDYSVTTIPNVGRQPHGVIFTPDGGTAYITTENLSNPVPPHHPTSGGRGTSHVIVIDVPTRQIVRQIEVGAWGQGLCFVP